jgi:Zn-finger nucleic acid-binding protein
MPVKPTESEEAYFARLEMACRTHALAAQESRATEEERQRLLAVAKHHCPKWGAPLVTLHHRGVEIEQCSHCQGVWLDRGALEQVLAKRARPGVLCQSETAVGVRRRQATLPKGVTMHRLKTMVL